MKVIVCFDSVRVIVPCGDGEILVRELITKAIHRYRKATGKAGSHWVDVLNLKTISGGGILDPDDQLNDVCDDREQLIADFDEEGRPPHHNGGDGASASSTGTTSPEMFQGQDREGGGSGSDDNDYDSQGQGPGPPTPTHRSYNTHSSSNDSNNNNQTITNSPTFPLIPRQENGKNDIIVTPRDLTIGSTLRVRRGSEPALNTLGDDAIQKPLIPINNGIIALHRRESVRESDEPNTDSSDEENSGKSTLDRRKKALLARFSRDAFRTSLSNRPEMFVWMEAQERQEEKFKQGKEEKSIKEDIPKKGKEERKGPVGASTTDTKTTKQQQQETGSTDCTVISLSNDGGPLGIHVVPASDDNGRDMGLMIQSVEPGGRIQKDGRLSQGDRIVEINGVDLASSTFTRAQDIFRSAMKTDEIRLKVVKVKKKPKPAARQPPAVMPKPRGHAPAKPSPLTLAPLKNTDSSDIPASPDKSSIPSKKEPSPSTSSSNGDSTLKTFFVSSPPKSGSYVNGAHPQPTTTSTPVSKKSQPIKPAPPIHISSPTKKTPPAVPVRHPTTSLTTQGKERPISAVTNTRKIGRKIEIDLKKGPLGLGFSVTSRDNVTGGDIPIYIKNILPKGAAIQDGCLKPGDRLLEVNGVSMSGKTQAEVVTMLRNTPQGSVVSMLVSRQEEVDERFTVPREMNASNPADPHGLPQKSGQEVEEKEVVAKPQADKSEDDKGEHLQPLDHSEEDLPAVVEKAPQEEIHLEIPLNDTESAGLGVSVKGKTVTTEQGQRDLGIFVKGVIAGGAASKDGRLQLNDQLLDVNGIKLHGIPNVAAMENLRRAMTTEGPIPGYIQLSVARKIGAPSPFPLSESSHDSSQNEMMMRHYRTRSDLSQTSDFVDSPNHSRQSSTSKVSDSEIMFFGDRTPSKEMLGSGHNLMSASNLRNESYLRANNDSLNDSSAFSEAVPSPGAFRSLDKNRGKMVPNVRPIQDEEFMMEEEDPYAHPNKSPLKQRPHSTIGFFGPEDEEGEGEESDLSPTSPIKSFHREGFGRQSMSEKRKGHVDPRSSEVYQRAKATKDHQKEGKGMERNYQREGAISAGGALGRSGSFESLPNSPTDPDPSPPHPAFTTNPGMTHDAQSSMHRPAPVREIPTSQSQGNLKHSSSVEDLSHAEPQAEPVTEEPGDPQVPAWRLSRLGRIRPCNESFRAAVDRSYDPVDSGVPMDTLEEESMESGSFSVGQRSTSGRSSFSSENAGEDYNSLKKKKAKDRKAGGGLLGFLRLGKGRKSTEDIGHSQGRSRSRSEERPSHLVISRDPEAAERVRKLSQQHVDDSRLKDQYQRIQEQQQRQLQHQQQLQQQLQQQQQQLRLQQQAQQRLASTSSLQSDSSSHTHPQSSSSRTESPFRPYQNEQHKGQVPAPRGRPAGAAPTRQRGDGAGGGEGGHLAGAAANRAERIQQLRQQHQQQHRARQGVYPMEQKEEIYEQRLQEDIYDQRLQDDEIRYTVPGEAPQDYPRMPQQVHHHNLRAEIHHDPRTTDPHRHDPRGTDESHHYHNSRIAGANEEYAEPLRRSDMHPRNFRADIQPKARMPEFHQNPPGEGVHSHRADVHHNPRAMEFHQNPAGEGVLSHRADIHHDPRAMEFHQNPAREGVHSHRADVHHDPRSMETHQTPRGDIHRRSLRAEIHPDPRRERPSLDPRSHLGVYDNMADQAGGNYSHQFSRPTSRQSETYRNSPYPSVSSMGSDSNTHPHAHNYPPHASHTLTGYDPHLLHHHHHHHLPHAPPHPHDMYDYESHYGTHEDRPGKRDSYVERQRQYFDESVRGFQDPPHRGAGYSATQRPVLRYTDPGSAKV
ncbi:partitioning defective 3 homolog isoform X2 [Littorina saxatilis]|uniref:PDZ domain-containing protein n=1 Tax=Littorina saxatilis TaxID=31220 RepID=A0AAN9GK44_9CAEN